MFEKLHYGTAERLTHPEFSSDAGGTPEEGPTYLLPGDMKEVLPDPLSTLHHVYISEPVPGYRELFQRMQTTQLKPDNHLLVFLVETCSDFDMGLELLVMAKDRCNGIIGRILDGTHDQGDHRILMSLWTRRTVTAQGSPFSTAGTACQSAQVESQLPGRIRVHGS